ncbi:amidase [Cupriavidus necator]
MSAQCLPATICGLRDAIASGQFDADEAGHAQLDWLRSRAAALRCVVEMGEPQRSGMRQGRATGQGRAQPILAGVGLAHKDIFARAGSQPRCGRTIPPAQAHDLPPATALLRLDAAGALDLATLQMAEFACGATGENAQTGEPVNPLDAAAAVGGSSSGSAVAVAGGLCYASLGTDTAGSVRIPAATCGVLGLKPTRGMIPTRGVFPLAPSLDSVGIIARSAADAACLLAVTALHRKTLPLRLASQAAGTMQASLLATPEIRLRHCFDAVEVRGDVLGVLNGFVAGMPSGLRSTSTGLGQIDTLNRAAQTLLHTEAAQVHWARLRDPDSGLGRLVRAVTLPGLAIPAVWYREALAKRESAAQQMLDTVFDGADIVLTPALPLGVPDWAEVDTRSAGFNGKALAAMYRLMSFVNYLGFPAVVFPVGHDARGRPVSVQAIGRPHAEGTLLSFAYRVERDLFGTNGFTLTQAACASSFDDFNNGGYDANDPRVQGA